VRGRDGVEGKTRKGEGKDKDETREKEEE